MKKIDKKSGKRAEKKYHVFFERYDKGLAAARENCKRVITASDVKLSEGEKTNVQNIC